MLDFDLIKNILIISVGSGIITTSLIQKIKESINTKKYLGVIAFFVSMIIGTLFSLSFSDTNLFNSLWCGLFSFIGADLIYKAFEDKIFKPFSKLNEVVEVPKENYINRGE